MSQPQERYAGLALIPGGITFLYYWLPPESQSIVFVQFLPQLVAYVCLALWVCHNPQVGESLGLDLTGSRESLKWGCGVGGGMGIINAWMILYVVPGLGGEIEFLRETPHAKVPEWLMVPWCILIIAAGVELNFRGFQLGRFLTLLNHPADGRGNGGQRKGRSLVAVAGSAFLFAFDPFLVATFRHLHWIAVWDGMIWGWLWVRKKNLYTVILAHAIEVVILYLCVKSVLM